jgi:pilus assembly protein CpaE
MERDAEQVARVVLALEGHDLAEEVMHFLDRSGRARVVATATDERQLAEAIRQLEPDAVVASPALAGSPLPIDGRALLAVDTVETVAALRAAIGAGAGGFFLWPQERERLAAAAARVAPSPERAGRRAAPVVAVYGPRGGVGTTFLATHLAAAYARQQRECVLVDLDLAFADVSVAVGAPTEGGRTILDLLPVAGELSARHLDEVLWRHPDGFRVLLAPHVPPEATQVVPAELSAAVAGIRRLTDVVLLHVPRGLDEVTHAALTGADRVLVVLHLDVASFRAARRAIAAAGIEQRCVLVVNRAGRADITPSDVERVFGRPASAVIRIDRAVPLAQDRGRLLPGRGRTARAVSRLASIVLEGLE